MEKNGKKGVLIFLIIFVLIIAGLGATLFVLMKNETIAITKDQKLIRGIKDISKNIEQSVENEKVDNIVDNLYSKAFRNTTTITAKANEFELKYFNGFPQMTEEIRNMIDQAKIQSITEVDIDNKVLNQKLLLKVGDVLNSLTGEANIYGNEIGVRVEELNDKYLYIENQNEELFNKLEETLNNLDKEYSIEDIKLTNSEKSYFIENYSEIFTNNITDDMIEDNSATISINAKEIKCSEISITLNKTQITNILTQIIQKLESDETGKSIIISKLKKINDNYSEEELKNILDYFKSELIRIDDNINLKIKMYCDYFKTYGITFDINTEIKTQTVNYLFEADYQLLELKTRDTALNLILANNTLQINLNTNYLENRINLVFNQTKEGIGEGVLNIINNENNGIVKIIINTDLTKLDDIKIKLRVQYNDNDNNIDITFNIEYLMEKVNGINKKLFNNTNSINTLSVSDEERQEYIDKIFNNIEKLIKNAADNSKLINVYYKYYSNDISEALENTKNGTSFFGYKTIANQAEELAAAQSIQIFNQQFKQYEGEQNGRNLKGLYQAVQMSNEMEINEHIVLWNCNYSMDEIENTRVYTVTFEYDNEGYINKIVIK